MKLLIFIVILTSILLSITYILRQINFGKYKMKSNNSVVRQQSIQNFEKEYPEKNINDLKIEIEKISDMLLDNQESNRYTTRIQEKAKNDSKLDEFRDLLVDNVEIIKYKKNKMKAQVNYILGNIEYTIVMEMKIVNQGRAFLKNYKTMKRVIA